MFTEVPYLTQITNLRISNKNPLEYLQDYVGSQFAEVQRTHLLPDLLLEWVDEEKMSEDALDLFVDARLELVLTRLRDYLSGMPFEFIDTRPAAANDFGD